MLGFVAYHTDQEPPGRVLGGVRFRVVYVAPGGTLRARLSAKAAARTLAREGVRWAVLPEGYVHGAAFAARGILPPPLAPLYRATAAAIVRRYMAQRDIAMGSATIVFASASVTPELRRAAESLCADVRYVALAIPRGGEALARSLKHGRGVAVRLLMPGEAFRAGLVVDFDGAAEGEGVLRLGETLRVRYDSELPNALLAALWQAGALDAGTLRVDAVGPA